jgi:TolB-like protein/DNA-binding winged helix-turn-helix (wHTH) protein/Flp pilus assembly protein TadD
METASARVYEFGDFRLDPVKRRLLRRDDTAVPLTPRVFDTLLFLVEHQQTVLDKERLMEAVWPDSIVEENNLTQNVSSLRRVFGDTPGSNRYIATVPGRGYRFVADVRAVEEPDKPVSGSSGLRPPEVALVTKPDPVGVTRSVPRRVVGVGLLIIAAAAIALVAWQQAWRAPRIPDRPASIPPKSIAVLPFENLSNDPANAYFASGVQDEILSNLAKIADLKVISRTSANLYKTGAPRNTREIGEQLRVAHILEGSVQRSNDRVRVHAQLIDTRTDTHLWAQTYDREIANVFAIQSEIAETIASQLHAKISDSEKAAVALPPTRDLVAKDLYLQAAAARSDSVRNLGLDKAIALLEQAISRDPAFVQAYCALARDHVDLYSSGYNHTPSHLDAIQAIIEKAARLDPDAGEVHLTRAHYLARGRRDYDGARAELELARRFLPNDATVYYEIALTDRRQGRWSEAIANFERAIELDPLNSSYVVNTSNTYAVVKRYADATRLGERALALAPRNHSVRLLVAYQPFSERGEVAQLRAALEAVLAETPEAGRDISNELFYCAMLQRDHDAMARALALIPPEGVGAVADAVWPREWYVALAAHVSGQPEVARTAFEATRALLLKSSGEQPGNASTFSLLGRVEALLGNKEAAINASRRACELQPLAREPTSGLKPLNDLARVYAIIGEKDRAIEILATYAGHILFTDYGHLKLEPDWDSLRGDARFEKILASLAPE